MAQIFVNSIEGVLSANLPSGSTTISGAFVSELPVVSNPDIVVLTIDPDEEEHPAEIVHVTAHSSGASTATIVRARESTVQPAQWDANRKVVAGLTKAGLDTITASVTTVQGNLNSETNARIADVQDAEAAATSALSSHASGTNHPLSTSTTPGMMSAAQWGKLNAIEGSATQDQTASEILTLINSVDGPGSGLNADLLDGVQGASYSQTSHGHADYSQTSHTHTSFGAISTGNVTVTGTVIGTSSITAASFINSSAEYRILGNKVLAYDSTAPGFTALYSGAEPVINGDGSDELYLYGVPFAPGAYQLECDEIAGGRRVKYDTLASSRRFKDNEQAHSIDPAQLRSLAGWLRSFTYKADPSETRRVNYIVEDVQDLLDPEAVRLDDDGEPLKFDVNWMISALIEGYIDLAARVEALEG